MSADMVGSLDVVVDEEGRRADVVAEDREAERGRYKSYQARQLGVRWILESSIPTLRCPLRFAI